VEEQPRDPRVRRTWAIAGGGLAAGVALALVSALLGGSGRVGMAVLLLVTALGSAVAALYGLVTAVVDDLRHRPVARARPVAAVGLFVVAAMLMAMVAGIGG
jgi:predicted lipid-binding transport protein (Tim44 family)